MLIWPYHSIALSYERPIFGGGVGQKGRPFYGGDQAKVDKVGYGGEGVKKNLILGGRPLWMVP